MDVMERYKLQTGKASRSLLEKLHSNSEEEIAIDNYIFAMMAARSEQDIKHQEETIVAEFSNKLKDQVEKDLKSLF